MAIISAVVAVVKTAWRHSRAGGIVLIVFIVLTLAVVVGVAIKWVADNAKQRRIEGEATRRQLVSLHSKLPARVTANWIRQNVPTLPAEEVPHLIRELHRRGWKAQDIEIKVLPYVREQAPLTREPARGEAQLSVGPDGKRWDAAEAAKLGLVGEKLVAAAEVERKRRLSEARPSDS